MIGQSIEARPRMSIGAIVFLILGLLMLGLALVFQLRDLAVGAAGPLVLAATLALSRPGHFVASFTESGLEIEHPPRTIGYEEIESVRGWGRNPNPFSKGKKYYPIEIITPQGPVVIPSGLNVPADQVFLFLYQRCENRKTRGEPSSELRDYFRHKQKAYGPERVHAFKTRSYFHSSSVSARNVRFFFLTVALVGVVWFGCGLALREEGWWAVGLALVIMGTILWGVLWLVPGAYRISNKKLRQASLVISPDGLALVQGPLTGQLRWDEVRNVKMINASWANSSAHSGTMQANYAQGGIHVKVAGAVIPILDIYDGPLPLIFQLISYYRRGEEKQDTAERIWKDVEETARRKDRRGDPHVTEI